MTLKQSEYNAVFAQKQEREDQLNNEETTLNDFESKRRLKEQECNDIQQSIKAHEAKQNSLQDQLEKIFQQSKTLLLKKNALEEKLSSLHMRRDDPSLKISSLKLSLLEHQAILKQPEPEQKYVLDGEYCINNIYHCKNHPPRKVLTNGEEIAKYHRARTYAQEWIQRITEEIIKIENESAPLKYESENLTSRLEITNNEYEKMLTLMNSIQEQMQQNTQEIELFKLTYEYLLQEKSDLNFKITQAQQTISEIKPEMIALETKLMNVESELETLRQELEQEQSSQASQKQIMLEEMADEEIRSEENSYFSKDQSEPTDFNLLARLREMAMREIEEEEHAKEENQSLKTDFSKFGDNVMDKLIDSAKEAELISDQARKNLKNIKSFLNHKVEDAKQDLEKAQHEILKNSF
jgi:chromosome segregation ATPase